MSQTTQVPKKLEGLIQGKACFHPRLILSLSLRKRSSSPLAFALALPLSTELTAASAPLQCDIVQRLGQGEGSTQRRVEEGEGTGREEVQAGRVQESTQIGSEGGRGEGRAEGRGRREVRSE
jgi:hypothetical protein